MKRGLVILMAGWIGMAALAVPQETAAASDKAACLVCKVTKGETGEEEVKALRAHDGKQYGFCSEKCAKAFEVDPAAYLPPVLPRPAPDFSLKDLAGNPLSKESLKGKIVLLDFWATWCVPCRKAMPGLQSLHQKFAGQGFAVVGISIDEGGETKVKKYVASKKIIYPIAVDSEKSPAWDAFRIKAVPAAYLLDREGRIVAQWTGAAARTKELEGKLEELLAAERTTD